MTFESAVPEEEAFKLTRSLEFASSVTFEEFGSTDMILGYSVENVMRPG